MMTEKSENKLELIKEKLVADLLGCDLQISIFVSALLSFKRESQLVPFPLSYMSGSVKDFERLTSDVMNIPALEEVLVLMMAGNTQALSASCLDILYCILVSSKFSFETISRSEFDKTLLLCKNASKIQMPKYIFKVHYNDDVGAEKKFRQLSLGENTTKFAYHGTKASNLYSIMNYGLNQHLNKTGLFGEGLYLAQELQVSLLFSQSVLTWDKSRIGELMSSVAICEFIQDPRYVKFRKENAKNSDIPHSYLLITNNEVVRVRYLCIYPTKSPTSKKAKTINVSQEAVEIPRLSLMKWCRKNPLIVSVLVYVCLLFLVGISNHRAIDYYKNNIIEFLNKRFKFL